MELKLGYRSNDRSRAEAAFKKVERAQEGEMARTGYAAEALAVRDKTSRLRSLRLAKEAGNLKIMLKRKRVPRATSVHAR